MIAQLVKDRLGYKFHWAVSDYLQRSARHIASKTDFEQATAVGKAAVAYALAGQNAVMPVIKRLAQKPYRWRSSPRRSTHREPRKEDAGELHPRRRLRHHRRLPPLPRSH
jgi:6-phosphofructokinase